MACLFEGRATLDEVSRRAGVSVQTVLRHFPTRADLMQAAAAEAGRRVVDQRGQAPAGDVGGSVKVLFIHHETYGDRMIQALGREADAPELAAGLTRARADHRRWVARTYRSFLDGRSEPDRERTLNALLVATDVSVWKLLRRDLGLPRREAEATMTAMVQAIARSAEAEPPPG
jgi:AcrR family transcriptional regulator